MILLSCLFCVVIAAIIVVLITVTIVSISLFIAFLYKPRRAQLQLPVDCTGRLKATKL